MKTIALPSGAKLDITVSPFGVSKALYQAVLEEAKTVKAESSDSVLNLSKDVICTLLSSQKVEAALNECMKKVVYNGKRIDSETFEPVAAREDYLLVCMEVAKENITPFMKPLYARYSPLLEKLKIFLA